MPHEGPAALPEFRRVRLLETLRQSGIDVQDIRARFLHFLDLSRPLEALEQDRLQALLAYGPRLESTLPAVAVVVPRGGTISPWSSKATDIAHCCGLAAVRRIERGVAWLASGGAHMRDALRPHIHDRMTESVHTHTDLESELFAVGQPKPLRPQSPQPQSSQHRAGNDIQQAIEDTAALLGVTLDEAEFSHLVERYQALGRPPTDVELMMFAQVNSEHCRHKIFNAAWTLDGRAKNQSLFDMIRNTHRLNPGGVLSAYSDNAAVLRGWPATGLAPDPMNHVYNNTATEHHILIKVETHNHPSAISPFAGAATGSGGEIRDEAATGRGARAKAGLTGFCVSNLLLPENRKPWEQSHGKPQHIASALDIMLEGPIGAAGYNNEFGRPAILGFFRSFELAHAGERFGFHKPIMVAGGLGNIRPENVHKNTVEAGMHVVVLGGPAMLIGLGGAAASSASSGTGDSELDFASVQRGNAEMQRRCQEVIDACWAMGEANPIQAIHDVGAGGLSNAIPEIVHPDNLGAKLELRHIPNADPGMSPMQIWCNEAQERYVLTVAAADMERFLSIAGRERCPAVSLGRVTRQPLLRLHDDMLGEQPVDLDMETLLGRLPRRQRDALSKPAAKLPLGPSSSDLEHDILAVLGTPTVGDKSFLITIGDRSVGGLVHRDQMVGPYQVPVADCAVTLTDYRNFTGEAMAMGERPPIAVLNAPASARMAVAEALTNLAAAAVGALDNVALSANWMAACAHPGQDAALYQAVEAVGLDLCPALGISIPVGKDSLSMKTVWQHDGEPREVISPLSLIVSAFAPVTDVRKSLTPLLDLSQDSVLLFIDLALGETRLGASTLAVIRGNLAGETPDLCSPQALRAFFETMQSLIEDELVLAYHDRSDGGLVTAIAEMCFASGCGAALDISTLDINGFGADPSAVLLCEELGAVLQVATAHCDTVIERFAATTLSDHRLAAHGLADYGLTDYGLTEHRLTEHGLADHIHLLGRPTAASPRLTIHRDGALIADLTMTALRQAWSQTSHLMAKRRDHPGCADEEHNARLVLDGAGLGAATTTFKEAPALTGTRPRVALLREQGVNGHVEMAAAFRSAGFEAVDVHMSDIHSGRTALDDFQVLAACGGFSYGDVLGGGGGWAASIRFNNRAHDAFAAFFAAHNTLTLGVCNGCQMLAQLKSLIPGSELWPRFVRNRSEQFEARLSLVEILKTNSAFLAGMEGAKLPVPVAHGEGRALFDPADDAGKACANHTIALRYVDGSGGIATRYPANPNGSPLGITGLTTTDGRATIMMPHPERAFRTVQLSWHPPTWQDLSPWFRMFTNAQRALT
ncbi:MAG: phosphoribosylformylglycinamidine synthase [Gammaproteobacteria bacterium]|nr:phosphoribosylformylglycinamidine synthase [Gammaproteobacteria bacterium]